MNREERLNDPEESLRLAMESHQSKMWTAMPGIVGSVNFDAQTVSVQLAVKGSVSSADGANQLVNLPLLVDVPIVYPRAGGFALTFPIAAGDEVLVVFGSRCIDSWWQSGAISAPAEYRMHDLSDGFAILAPTSQPKKLTGVSGTNVQLRDTAGTTMVEITPGGTVRVLGASLIDITAPTINLTGDINMTGNITATGQMTQTGGMTIGGITFGSHKHPDPQGGATGEPIN